MKTWTLFKSDLRKHRWIAPVWVELLWEPRDLWVGVFVRDPYRLYILPIPTLGIRVMRAQRVLCHNPTCTNPASIKCVYRNSRTGYTQGEAFARDPMCSVHGDCDVPCHSDPLHSFHVAIPDGQQWRWDG